MSLPGFTAGASLYKTRGHYRAAATSGQNDGPLNLAQILLRLSFGRPHSNPCIAECAGGCHERCELEPQHCNYNFCFRECIDNCCDPRCGSCNYVNGRCQQSCVDSYCNKYM